MSAGQQLVQDKSRQGFQKHLLRFHRRNELGRAVFEDSRAELILTNSHDGGSAFRLFSGVYRMVCMNGLVVGETFGEFAVRHSHHTLGEVMQAAQKIGIIH